MNIRHFLLPLIFFWGIISLLFPSCNKKETSNTENNEVENLIKSNNDSIYINPSNTEKRFIEMQKRLSDSANYYQLELFRAFTRILQGDEKSLDRIHDSVSNYCKRHPEAKLLNGLYCNHKAVILRMRNQNDSAIEYFKNSLQIMKEIKQWERSIDVSINLADLYGQVGNIGESAGTYRNALYLCDSLNLKSSKLPIYIGLGSLYSQLGNYNEAQKYFELASPHVKDMIMNDKFIFYNTYGNHLYFQKSYPQAISIFRMARCSALKMEQPESKAIADANLGEVFMLSNNLDSAQYYLDEAKRIFKEQNMIDYARSFYLNSILGELALHKKDFKEANTYLSMNIDTTILSPKYLLLHFKRLQSFYAHKGEYRKAYEYLMQATKYDDSLKNQQTRNQISELEYRYKQDTTLLHNNLQITQKEEEVKELHITLYIFSFIVIILIIVVSFAYIYKRKISALTEMKMRNSLYSLRMENMRNRISPHFFFNVLNREQANSRLVKLLRMNLEVCDRYIISFKEEIDFIDAYLDTEKDALGDNFTFDYSVDKNVNIDTLFIPSMMIEIFVENAVKHGLRGFSGEKYIRLNISRNENGIMITIRNNGNECKSISSGSTGTGLRIVTQTIQILNENNHNKIVLEYGSVCDPNGTPAWNVNIFIPNNYNFNAIQLPKSLK